MRKICVLAAIMVFVVLGCGKDDPVPPKTQVALKNDMSMTAAQIDFGGMIVSNLEYSVDLKGVKVGSVPFGDVGAGQTSVFKETEDKGSVNVSVTGAVLHISADPVDLGFDLDGDGNNDTMDISTDMTLTEEEMGGDSTMGGVSLRDNKKNLVAVAPGATIDAPPTLSVSAE